MLGEEVVGPIDWSGKGEDVSGGELSRDNRNQEAQSTLPPRKRLFLNLRRKKAMRKVPSMRMRDSRAVLGWFLGPGGPSVGGRALLFSSRPVSRVPSRFPSGG